MPDGYVMISGEWDGMECNGDRDMDGHSTREMQLISSMSLRAIVLRRKQRN